MREKSIEIGIVKKKYESIRGRLNEKSRCIQAASEAEESDTVRIRRKGSGRKRLTEKRPDILSAIKTLTDPSIGGDPESPLLRICKSIYKIA